MIKKRLQDGECLIGTWCEIPSPYVANIIAKSGMDFLIIDMEHGSMDFKVAQEMSMAVQAEGGETLIRVSGNDKSNILRSLDVGCAGIIVPHVKNVRDREDAVLFSKFKPLGQRSYNPYIRALGYSAGASLEQKNKDSLLVILLEDAAALKNLEEIIDSPEVDVIYLGKYDLAVSLGCGIDISNEKVNAVMEEAIKKIVQMKKVAGLMVHSKEEIDHYRKLGVGFMVYKVDSSIIYENYKEIKNYISKV
jgi:4-hydroxy-2-oxoheptanedioate aldolase